MFTKLSRHSLSILLGLSTLFGNGLAQEWCEECCCCEEGALDLSVSHSEGSGLGYSIGYTSFKFLLAYPLVNQNFSYFLDLRGHAFNNGKHAENAGLGVRYLSDCYAQIWGINLFYDHLKTSHHCYNQVGVGVEMLGETWNFQVNTYLPVGHTRKNIYRINYPFLDQLRRGELTDFRFRMKAREQFALKGVDALFGYHLCNFRCMDILLSAGPYYYWGHSAKTENAFRSKHKSSVGGRFLIDISLNEFLALEGTVTYDSIFKCRGQVTLTLNVPLDFLFQMYQCRSCTFRDRLFEGVRRNEIIAVDHLTRITDNPNVLDPEFQP